MTGRWVGCSQRSGTLPPERRRCQIEPATLKGPPVQAYTAPVSRRTQVPPVLARPALVIVLLATAFGLSPSTQEARAPVTIRPDTLIAHVQMFAGEIGERNTFRPQALRRAAAFIEQTWRNQGYAVTRQEYAIGGHTWANLEITRRGRENPDDIILVGAHYDSVIGCPGANDNATGVAALLELSRLAAAKDLGKSLRFVAFVNEEPPHFQTALMGSRVYAQEARTRGDRIRAMLSLETLGYYSEAPGSQAFPFPSALYRLFYPDRGNFILFVSNFGSRSLMRQAVDFFRAHTDFPVETIATFEWVPGVDWSDHGSFWAEGYPALMVTDTALYRYPHYHTEQDTPEKVDYGKLARVVDGLAGMLWALGR
jgi:hypothetical protein